MPTKSEQIIILRDAFNLPPDEAIAYMESKGMRVTWSWKEAMNQAAQQSFTVAKSIRMDILQDIRGAVEKSIAEGRTFYDFRKELEPTLRAKGWWGKAVVDGKEVQLGSPHRLKTIYRTNMQSAMQAGRYEQQISSAPADGWLRYVAISDQSTRTSHREMDNFQRPASDPIWSKIYPPNGFNCRCRVMELDEDEALASGGASPDSQIPPGFPDPGFETKPGLNTFRPAASDYDPDIWREAENG